MIPPSTQPYSLQYKEKGTFIHDYRNTYLGYAIVDSVLVDLFSEKKDGFFVEAGALDGEYLSNTLRLEQEQNWTGLLVEPDPDSFKELVAKNRKSWLSETCFSINPYPDRSILSKPREVDSKSDWLLRASAALIEVSKRSVSMCRL